MNPNKRYDMVVGLCIRPAGQERFYDHGDSYAEVPLPMVHAAQTVMAKHQAAFDKVLQDLAPDMLALGLKTMEQTIEQTEQQKGRRG